VKSETGFTSGQCKKLIYGREKHRVRRSEDEENRKVKGRKKGK